MDDDFIYTMVSGDSDGGSFTNFPNDILDFSAGYEVCLQDMLFMPGSWYNVRDASNYLMLGYGDEDDDAFVKVRAEIPPGNYYIREDFVTALNMAIAAIPIDAYPASDAHKIKYFDGKFTLLIPNPNLPDVGTLTWTATHKLYKIKIRFSRELAYLIGVVDSMLDIVPWIEDGWVGQVKYFDLLKNTLPLIWVFADFVGTTIIGNLREPLLRMVPIQVGSGILEHSIFAADQYVGVKRKRMQALRVYIRDSILASQPLKIQGRIVLTLHFRLRQ
jgi:hypothetical protein